MANNIQKLLTAWLAPFQDIENCLQQLVTERSVDDSVGAQLDVLGKIVGQSRLGQDDDLYRRYIRARISANRSKGRISDILRVSDLIVYDDAATYVLDNEGAAAYVLRVEGTTVTIPVLQALAYFLRSATSAGVRSMVQGNQNPATSAFNFSNGPGKGFGQLPQLDLAPLTTNVDTVVRHRDSRIPTLALTADGAGAGTLTNAGDAWTFHFQSGVTTVAQFESAINASSGLVVLTADGVGTMGAGDVVATTPFTKSVTGGKFACVFE